LHIIHDATLLILWFNRARRAALQRNLVKADALRAKQACSGQHAISPCGVFDKQTRANVAKDAEHVSALAHFLKRLS